MKLDANRFSSFQVLKEFLATHNIYIEGSVCGDKCQGYVGSFNKNGIYVRGRTFDAEGWGVIISLIVEYINDHLDNSKVSGLFYEKLNAGLSFLEFIQRALY